ncbi:MAG: hypothetical protein WC243_02170 [Patescibacteria group bacterium]|jgi:hypothetical protein
MKRKLYIFGALILVTLVGVGIAAAAFGDKGKVLGSSFSVGSADIKLLKDVSQGLGGDNLADEVQGPLFSNVAPNWQRDYLVKIYNNATTPVALTSYANYETANDPDDLRSIIFVEPFVWTDLDSDGTVDEGETGASLGKKTLIKWKTEGYSLGNVNGGSVYSLILRFSTGVVSDTKQGKTAIFDFEFNSLGL